MKGYRPSRVTIIAVCCAVATIAIISFLLLTILQPGADNHKKASASAATAGTSTHPTHTSISTAAGVSTVPATATAPITQGTSIPNATSTSNPTGAFNPTNTPTANPTRDPDPTSFTISVKGGGSLPFNGTVGQQSTQPGQYDINVDYPDPNLPHKSPSPGPITWSISATSQDKSIGNWLTLSPTSRTIYYGGPEQHITVTASVLPSMKAGATYTMQIQVIPNQTTNYGTITLALSDATPTPTPTADPDPTSFTISVQGATYCYTATAGQSGVQPASDNPPPPDIIYDGSTNPSPGPINWSVAALAQGGASCSDRSPCTNLSGNWLTFEPSSGSIVYGSHKTITLQASGATNMPVGVYCTKMQFYPINSDKDYAYAELIVSAPTPTPKPSKTATVQSMAFLPFASSLFFCLKYLFKKRVP